MSSEASRAFFPAVAGLLFALAAVPVYILTIDNPWLRSTGAAGFALMFLGTGTALWATTRDRRWRVRIPALLTVVLTSLWVIAFCWYGELPKPGAASTMAAAADFTLQDQDGRACEPR